MVAVCDPRYDISSYFGESRDVKRQRASQRSLVQSPSGACTTAECGVAERTLGAIVDWKFETLGLLDVAVEVPSLDWHKLYAAMQRIFPTSVVVEDTSELQRKFTALTERWRDETAMLSSAEMIAMHPAYQRIIGMGPEALPLILRELSREPGHWFWALSAITDENPVRPEDAGNLPRMSEAWLHLGRKRGWI
jgi:hypothetical protein